jgi:EmrB/QacA subfamily drug resistance transporter
MQYNNQESTRQTKWQSVMTKISKDEGLPPQILRISAVVLMGPFMTNLDSTVVNISLPTIRQEFHSAITSAQWIISGYLLALALMLPLNGWLVDRLGAKRLYLGCFSAFTLASILCGLSQTMDGLIWMRVLQGMAGGLLAPMAQMMIARVAGRRYMARIMGYGVVPILIAPILGPVVAGAILKYAGWRWIFYLNIPVGILAIWLAAFLLPSDETVMQKHPFDFPGFLMLSPGLVCFIYGFETASHRNGMLFFMSGLILIGAFVWYALSKGSEALVDIHLFNNRTFSTAATTQFLSNGVAYGGQFLVPLFLITGCGLSAGRIGWLIAPMGIGMMCSYPFVGHLTERFGSRRVSTNGAAVALLGTLPFLWMTQNHFSTILTVVAMFICGVGQAGISIPSVSAAYSSVPREKLACATTAINIVQRLGGPLTTSLIAVLISLSTTHFLTSGLLSYTMAFTLLIGIYALTIWSSSRLPSRIHQKFNTQVE